MATDDDWRGKPMSAKPSPADAAKRTRSLAASIAAKRRAAEGTDQQAIRHPWSMQFHAAAISASKSWRGEE